jgi:acid phosphatase family membrane protein YuiD
MDPSNPLNIFRNEILQIAFITWAIAQSVKPFTSYLITHKWNWGMLISTGGMPSSHSTLVTSVAVSTGLLIGWATPEFAVAATLAMVVIYDAAGVRRQAGFHAEAINVIIQELLQGHPLSDKEFREMLGHTPIEVLGGILWGTISTVTLWYFWK